MDIICKCGHNSIEHDLSGCFKCAMDISVMVEDGCTLTECQVLKVHITEQQARLDTCRVQVEALVGQVKSLVEEREDLKQELEERRENFTVMLDRLLQAEQSHAQTRAQLSYVLSDNAQLRTVLVQVLTYLDENSNEPSFIQTLKNLQEGIKLPEVKHD